MNFSTVTKRGVIPFLLALTFWSPGSSAADAVAVEKRLPPDVLALVSCPSVAQLKSRFNASSMGQLMQDESFADFFQQIETQLEAVSNQIQEQAGVSLKQILNIPQGEFTFAVIRTPDRKLGFVMLIDFGKNRTIVDGLLEKAQSAIADAGEVEHSTEEIDGTTVHVYTPQAAAAADGAPEFKPSYCIRDTYYILGSSVPALQSILVRWDGDNERTLSSNATYAYIASKCRNSGRTPAAIWFIDPINLVTNALQMSGQNSVQASMFLGFLPTLGLNGFRGVGGSMDLATGDFDSESRTFMFVDQPASGVMGLFQFPAADLTPPEWVPADSSMYVQANWDVATAYKSVETLVDSFQGAGALQGMIDGMANSPDGPQLHLKKDVIDLLSGRIVMVSNPGTDDDLQTPRMLLALGLKGGVEKMRAVMAKIGGTPGFPGESRDFRGTTIYEFPTPASTIGLATSRGHLVLATDVSALEQMIRGDVDSLKGATDFQKTMQHIPDRVSAITYQKPESQLRQVYDLLRSGAADAAIPGLDLTVLPDFDAVKKYLPTSGAYYVPDKNGALGVSFSLKK